MPTPARTTANTASMITVPIILTFKEIMGGDP
jgi:hypothetical protein